MAALSPVYHPREPTDSPLWKILHNHYEEFKAGYDEHCEKQYGFFRPVVDEVVEEYLRCGDLHEGFARVRCTKPDCRHEYLLGAIVSVLYSVEHPKATMEVNYRATVHLLREAERLDFRAFVFAGSAAEYGDDRRLPLREEYALEKTRHLSAYGRSKYPASREVSTSPCGVALRFFNIYGPRQDPSSPCSGVITRFVSMALSREPLTIFGDGLQTRDFIYVSDVVEAYISASRLCEYASEAGERLYNVATGKVTSILELAQSIDDLLANQAKPAFYPERQGDIRFSAGSVEAFAKATKWQRRISLREGLSKTIEWVGEASKNKWAASWIVVDLLRFSQHIAENRTRK